MKPQHASANTALAGEGLKAKGTRRVRREGDTSDRLLETGKKLLETGEKLLDTEERLMKTGKRPVE